MAETDEELSPSLENLIILIWLRLVHKEKKEDIWLSSMTKAPTPTEMSKGQSDNTNNASKKFDYIALGDRLRTGSWSNYGHPTGVVNLVYGPNLPTARNSRVIKRTHLPGLVKQRYGPELRSKTLPSLKPEISKALDSLWDEIRSNNDAKVLRTAFKGHPQFSGSNMSKDLRKISKSCPLCKQAGCPRYDHFLSACRYLPPEDRQFMSRARQSFAAAEATLEPDSEDFDNDFTDQLCAPVETVPTTRRVSTKQSPHMKAYYNHHVVQINVDSGAEISMIRASIADHIGVN